MANPYKSLLSSPLGQDLLREFNELHAQKVHEAGNADDMQTAFGLLKTAAGVMVAVEHLQFLAVQPEDEGGKVSRKA